MDLPKEVQRALIRLESQEAIVQKCQVKLKIAQEHLEAAHEHYQQVEHDYKDAQHVHELLDSNLDDILKEHKLKRSDLE